MFLADHLIREGKLIGLQRDDVQTMARTKKGSGHNT
jgi:hypothetical protein